MAKTVTFGELMLKLSPEGYGRFFQSDRMQASFGGSEANVATGLAKLGTECSYVTKLPENALGQAAADSLRAFGVDTSLIVRGGDRIGIYFIEKGTSLRSPLCIYDRKGSAFALSDPGEYDWGRILCGAGWFHFSGITPALGENAVRICADALEKAKSLGVKVSFDLNHRSKLWGAAEAGKTLQRLLPYVDLFIANENQAREIIGEGPSGFVPGKAPDMDRCASDAEKYAEAFGFGAVALTARTSLSASDNDFGAVLYDGNEAYFSRTYSIRVTDRVGSGDAFDAGLIHSLQCGKAPGECVEFAAAAAALEHTVEGDYFRLDGNEISALVGGDSSGAVKR